jgi:hypothetical protein
MMAETTRSMDKVALGLCLGGVVLAVFVGMLGGRGGYAIFVAFQIAALVLGIVTRASPLGKTAAIASGILLVGSLLSLS